MTQKHFNVQSIEEFPIQPARGRESERATHFDMKILYCKQNNVQLLVWCSTSLGAFLFIFFIFFPSTNTDVFYALSGSFFLIASRSILLPIIFCFAFFFEIMFVCSSISTLKIGKFYKSSLHSFNLEQSKDNKNLHSLAHSVANNGIVFHIFEEEQKRELT